MMDLPAFFLAFSAMYYFLKSHLHLHCRKNLIYFTIFSLAASLLKVFPVILNFTLFFSLLGLYYRRKDYFKNNPYLSHYLYSNAVIIVLTVIWILLANAYNKFYGHNGIATLSEFFPVWSLTYEDFYDTASTITATTMLRFLSWPGFLFAVFIFIFNLLVFQKNDFLFRLIFIFAHLGSFAYFSLWFVFKEHDYYYMLFYYTLYINFVFALSAKKFVHKDKMLVKLGKISMLLLLFYNVAYSSEHVRMDYNISTDNLYFLKTKTEKDFYGWIYNDDYKSNIFNGWKKLKPVMDSLDKVYGPRKVICIPDLSPSISLYFLERKGWTEFNEVFKDEKKFLIKLGSVFKNVYLVTNDINYYRQHFLARYFKKEIYNDGKNAVFLTE
ncbi:MAG: hypothetical protein N3F09_07195 [Bacteroidia bacterium]|nr:hypothetical protein [Bacteroidia bacterium]